jgi:hypothetical protein
MKKAKRNMIILAVIFLIGSFKLGYAQSTTTNGVYSDVIPILDLSNSYFGSHIDGMYTAMTNQVNSKALREFEKSYGTVGNEKWYLLSNGYLAEFSAGNIKTAAVFDKKGNWAFAIVYYGEKELPDEVRAIVKKTYYDYTIHSVEELHVGESLAYIIHMDNETTWKNVKVADGEMELIQDFQKY